MIEIRQASPQEADWVRAIWAKAQHPLRAVWIEEHLRAGNCHLALVDGTIAGYIIFAHTLFCMGFVEMLFVVQEHRRQGIATALMNHAERLCKTDRIFVSTNESNMTMHHLLGGRGYTPCGMLDLDPGDPEMFYAKKLK